MQGQLYDLNINGRWRSHLDLSNLTLYVSPHLVINEKGYTKHYYADGERIVSRIGEGYFPDIAAEGDQPYFQANQWGKVERDNRQLGLAVYSRDYGNLGYLRNHIVAPEYYSPMSCYYYHTDHLGSSSWVTDESGEAIQYLDYLPFGETWINQHSTIWKARYTFSGKERDEETGYSYFGARYYDPDLSIWLSVDPMASKYPGLSSYVYCANNPLNYADPNGKDIWSVNEQGMLTKVLSYLGNDIINAPHTGAKRELSGNKVISAAYFDQKNEHGYITATMLNFSNKSDARNLFHFLGANTKVEWGYLESKDAYGNMSYSIGSAHNQDGETLIFDVAMNAKPGTLIRYDHSHSPLLPFSSGEPSTPANAANPDRYVDTDAWRSILRIFTQKQHSVLVIKNK